MEKNYETAYECNENKIIQGEEKTYCFFFLLIIVDVEWMKISLKVGSPERILSNVFCLFFWELLKIQFVVN